MGQEMNDGHLSEPLEHEKVVDKVREHGRLVGHSSFLSCYLCTCHRPSQEGRPWDYGGEIS